MPIRGKEQSDFTRDFAFVAVDEAQLGADPERGHVFTDRCSTRAAARRR
jgi:ATP-dependent RNA helicase SUPV3L1/SUV3